MTTPNTDPTATPPADDKEGLLKKNAELLDEVKKLKAEKSTLLGEREAVITGLGLASDKPLLEQVKGTLDVKEQERLSKLTESEKLGEELAKTQKQVSDLLSSMENEKKAKESLALDGLINGELDKAGVIAKGKLLLSDQIKRNLVKDADGSYHAMVGGVKASLADYVKSVGEQFPEFVSRQGGPGSGSSQPGGNAQAVEATAFGQALKTGNTLAAIELLLKKP